VPIRRPLWAQEATPPATLPALTHGGYSQLLPFPSQAHLGCEGSLSHPRRPAFPGWRIHAMELPDPPHQGNTTHVATSLQAEGLSCTQKSMTDTAMAKRP